MSYNPIKPTSAELEILQALWKIGPCSVKDVLNYLHDDRGYTTILKLLQIMTSKKLVKRVKKDRAHIYEASCSADQTQRGLISDLLNRVFDGSSSKLVMQALSTRKASKDELAEIRRMLDDLEGDLK